MKRSNMKRPVKKASSTKHSSQKSKRVPIHSQATIVGKVSVRQHGQYRDQLLELDDLEKEYDAVFEHKLRQQYVEFRDIKERKEQFQKVLRAVAVLVTIVLVTLLLLSYSS